MTAVSLIRKIALLGLDVGIATTIFVTIFSYSLYIAILSTGVYLALSFAMFRFPIRMQANFSEIFPPHRNWMQTTLLLIAAMITIVVILFFILNQ